MTEVMSATAWGIMEEEEEADIQLPLPEEFISASPNSRVRFQKTRKVVRYPSEQFLMKEENLLEPPTVINDEDDYDEENEEAGQVDAEPQESVETEKEPTQEILNQETSTSESKANGIASQVDATNSITKSQEVSNDTHVEDRKGWAQRAQVQRYVPRFAPPPPQPEEANNGEDEEEEDDEDEGGDDDDEDGYDSVVEDEDAPEPADDPIKKIAEETIVSRQQKLQILQQQQPQQAQPQQVQPQPEQPQPAQPPLAPFKSTEQDEMLKTISHIKDQLRDEVEKAEQASKAAAAAAQQALESNIQLSSRVANMRSFLAVLCGCGVRIVGMLVAAKLLDTAATQMRHTRTLLPTSILPSFLLQIPVPPLAPHLAVGTGVSLTHALLRHFLPRLRWRWLVGIDGGMGALVSLCAAALGGARGGRSLGCAMVAGCIVGILAASSSTTTNYEVEFLATKQTTVSTTTTSTTTTKQQPEHKHFGGE